MHFVGLCFGEFYEEALEYYNEGAYVDRYVYLTKDEAIDECKLNHAARYEKALEQLEDPTLSKEMKEYWNKVLEQGLFLSYEDAWKKVKEWGYELDEDENLMSTYNPNSKWDWYIIGGRWDNYLPLKERDKYNEIIWTNQAYFSEIDWDYMFEKERIPYCYVDPDGNWYDKEEESNFDQNFKNYVKTLTIDFLVTTIDFHI